MQVIRYPEKKDWQRLLQRPLMDHASLESTVGNILKEVRENGDDAVRRFSLMYDKVVVEKSLVQPEEIEAATALLDDSLKSAIQTAKENIETFHAVQKKPVNKIETMPGVTCWRKTVAIEKVGLYIPGGSAPLFSTILMLGIPAAIAGCKEVVLCTPPAKDGSIHPAVLYTAKLVGITKIFKIGGVQAIAAMAFGTATIPKVYKIFGPGNQFVTTAKLMVQREGVAIDMPAGPSEVAVLADDACKPSFVASDLLSQAEHGPDSQVLLVTDDEKIIEPVQQEVLAQLEKLPRLAIAEKALANSRIILVKDKVIALKILNAYAPEHLIIACREAEKIADKVVNAGSVFIGNYSPESAGDYASGTNHTLPTNGYAKAYSGVSVDSFVKKITFQQLTENGLQQLGSAITQMAMAEGLEAHARAVRVRIWEKK
jgi:histidinol dehydrogenase